MDCLKLYLAGPRDIWADCSYCHVNYLGLFWLTRGWQAGSLINRAGSLNKNSNELSLSRATIKRVERVSKLLVFRPNLLLPHPWLHWDSAHLYHGALGGPHLI
jgi:hypothetical protein